MIDKDLSSIFPEIFPTNPFPTHPTHNHNNPPTNDNNPSTNDNNPPTNDNNPTTNDNNPTNKNDPIITVIPTPTTPTDCNTNIGEIGCPLIPLQTLPTDLPTDLNTPQTISPTDLNAESPQTISTTLLSSSSLFPPIPTNTNANNSSSPLNLNGSNKIIMITIPIIIAIIVISIIMGLFICKRKKKRIQQGTILQFEPMHPHVVVVDADGNSLGKRNSIISSSGNSFIGGNRSPSRMIKVLAYDSCDEETESIVGNSISNINSKRRTMYYEDYR